MPQGRCRICGCVEEDACVSGELGTCWWVDEDQDLCSHCVEFLGDNTIHRPDPRPLTKLELAAAAKNNSMVIRPQFNHQHNGWMVVMYTGKGWSNRFSSNVHESKELAYASAREFALNAKWHVIVD